jgi:hypothetical protein
MKNKLLFGILVGSIMQFNAQTSDFNSAYKQVTTELTSWDPIRGEWLSKSILAMAKQEAVPERNFPEDLTPFELVNKLPDAKRSSILKIAQDNAPVSNQREWNAIARIVNRPDCKPVSGRSYGDPHLSSFDGATYSFQTVGEFVLAKSDGDFEIQTRQQAVSEDFSLNTAAAMNVGGDRVGIYPNEKPDNFSQSALRVNGQPVVLQRNVYFLPKGGTIEYSSNVYTVTWPTGEVARIQTSNGAARNFLNITVQVFPCQSSNFYGLMGNANGSANDDFDVRGNGTRPQYMAFSSFGNPQMQQATNQMEKEYLAFLARDYARQFRITENTSLFDYTPGSSTISYTDESYPRVHRTVADLSPMQQTNARNRCQEMGLQGTELNACIFDNAYLNIAPAPRPVIKNPTQTGDLGRIDRPVINNNQGKFEERETGRVPIDSPRPQPQSIGKDTRPSRGEVDRLPADNNRTNPVQNGRNERPIDTPQTSFPAPSRGDISKPISVPKPAGSNEVKPPSINRSLPPPISSPGRIIKG